MNVCGMERTLVHILRYMGQTNNNKILINNSLCYFAIGCIHSNYDSMRYTVYKWGFSCLDYSFDELISWNRNMGCTAGFTVFAFIRF